MYQKPKLYEKYHAEGIDDEIWLLETLHARHGNGGLRWLEPACGTGQYLKALRKKGWKAAGYDLSPQMAKFAKAPVGDMRSYVPRDRADAAFCLQSTFRHLMTDKDALAHLRCMRSSLNPGGFYVLGLDLFDYKTADDDEETWPGHVMISLTPVKRKERIINFYDGEKHEYDLRSYDWKEWSSLTRKSPFRIKAVYGPDGRPSAARTGYLYFVLK
jgi:SAM-dependent methyltransferase